MNATYTFGKTLEIPFEQALLRVTEALAEQGFGVLSDIDVAATLKKKLGLEVDAYRILGACNPQFAHRALQVEPEIGALLPCNVVVRAVEGGKVRVDVMDPGAVLGLVGRREIEPIAGEVRDRLHRVLEKL